LSEPQKKSCHTVFFSFHAVAGVASPILGLYLDRKGFGSFDYVCGEFHYNTKDNWISYSHAWLEKNNLLVDITGDQFYCRPSVYVGSKDLFFSRFILIIYRSLPL